MSQCGEYDETEIYEAEYEEHDDEVIGGVDLNREEEEPPIKLPRNQDTIDNSRVVSISKKKSKLKDSMMRILMKLWQRT